MTTATEMRRKVSDWYEDVDRQERFINGKNGEYVALRDGRLLKSMSTLEAEAKINVDAAERAAAGVAATSRYFPSRAAGETASAVDQLFSTDDGAGNLIYYRRTADGSTEVGRALTPPFLASPSGRDMIGQPEVMAFLSGTRAPKQIGSISYAGAFRYIEAPAGALDAHVVNSAGTKFYVDPETHNGFVIDAFGSFEAAVLAAGNAGVGLRGVNGRTYVARSGVTLFDKPLSLSFDECRIMRAAAMVEGVNRSLLRVEHSFSAATYGEAEDVISYTNAEINLANGSSYVARVEVRNPGLYAKGQIVHLMSSNRIPCIAPWPDTRYGEMAEIHAVIDNYVYMTAPLVEQTWTPMKICRMRSVPVCVRGGDWSDQAGYPHVRTSPLLEFYGVVRPQFSDMYIHDTASIQVSVVGCYEPSDVNNRYERARHSASVAAYSYGAKYIACMRPMQAGAHGDTMRHVFDTGGLQIADENLNSAPPRSFGGVIRAKVVNGVASNSLNAPFADHPDAFETLFVNCVSDVSLRRAPRSTLWGFNLRGRGSEIRYGSASSLAPMMIEPSTSIPMRISGVVLEKHCVNDRDASRDPMINIQGGGVIGGGKAAVIMSGVELRQTYGRKEIIKLDNANLTFDGSVEYAAGMSNAVIFNLDGGSSLKINRLDADFSKSVAETPMLVSIADQTSSVTADGKVIVRGSPVAGSGADGPVIVIASLNSTADNPKPDTISVSFTDVVTDQPLFGVNGFRQTINATKLKVIASRSDIAAVPGLDVAVNFSSLPVGERAINWPRFRADPVIHVAINATRSGMSVGSIPDGVLVGQCAVLYNVGPFGFAIAKNVVPNILVTTANPMDVATRNVLVGGSIRLRWNGTQWVC